MAIMHVLTNPVINLQPGILRGTMVSDCVRVGKLNTDVCVCGSAHTGECVVDGLGATAAY